MTAIRGIAPVLLLVLVGAACGDAGGRGVPADSIAADSGFAEVGDTTVPGGTVPDVSADLEVLSVCDTLTNSFDCARAIEGRRLPGEGRAARRGDTLGLVLAGGDTLRLVDEVGEHSDVVYYSYQGYWPGRGLFVVQRQYYEGADHLLIDDSTGERTVLPDRPLRAPGGARFAVLALDLAAGYGPNTLQVWGFEDGVPTLEWETRPEQWGPANGRWVTPDTLRLTQHGYCDQLGGTGRGMCERPAWVYRSGGEWHFEAVEDRGG